MQRRILVLFVLSFFFVLAGCIGGKTVAEKVEEKLNLANNYLQEGNYKEAILVLENIIEVDPRETEAYIILATIYSEQGEETLVEKILKDATLAVEDAYELRIYLAAYYENRVLLQEALLNYKKMLTTGEDSLEMLEQLISVYTQVDELDKLTEIFHSELSGEQLIWTFQKMINVASASAEVYLGLAKVYFELGKDNLVEEILQEAMENVQDKNRIIVFLADYYQSQRMYQEAQTLYHEVLSTDKNNIIAINGLIAIFQHKGGHFPELYDLLHRAYRLTGEDKYLHHLEAMSEEFYFESDMWIKVLDQGKTGFINMDGELMIQPKEYSMIGDFSDGMATVRKDGLGEDGQWGKMGFIDERGDIVIDLQFDSVMHFVDSIAAVSRHGQWHFIDRNGDPVFDTTFDEVHYFQKDGIVVENGGEIFTLSKQGEKQQIKMPRAIEHSKMGTDFPYPISQNGYIEVFDYYTTKNDFSLDTKIGLINFNGEDILPIEYRNIAVFSDDLIFVENFNERWGAVNQNNEEVIPFKYSEVYVREDFTVVTEPHDNKYVILNTAQETIEEYRYNPNARGFSDDTKTMVLHKILSTDYSIPKHFISEGSNGYGLLDRSGNLVLPNEYEWITKYRNDMVLVLQEELGTTEGYKREFKGFLLDLNSGGKTPPLTIHEEHGLYTTYDIVIN